MNSEDENSIPCPFVLLPLTPASSTPGCTSGDISACIVIRAKYLLGGANKMCVRAIDRKTPHLFGRYYNPCAVQSHPAAKPPTAPPFIIINFLSGKEQKKKNGTQHITIYSFGAYKKRVPQSPPAMRHPHKWLPEGIQRCTCITTSS